MNASRMTIHAALWINASGLAAVLAVNTPTVVLASVPHPGTTARAHVKTSDSRMKAQVEAALASDTRLRGSNVLVQSANDGVVVLAGTVKTMSDHLHATGDAARVRGVHRVANEVKIQDLLADEESRGEQRPPET